MRFSAYDNAIGFANVFRLLLTRTSLQALMEHGTYEDGSMMMPTVVNGALACELFLKALLEEPCREHSVIKLLNLVEAKEPGIKHAIETACIDFMKSKKEEHEYNSIEYQKDLGRIDKAFVDLRYWHEPKNPGASDNDPVVCNLGFLDVFIALLQGLCRSKFGPRPLVEEKASH